MNVMYLSSLVEGSLNIWYDSLDGVSAVSRPVTVQDNTETQKLYTDIHVQSCLGTRSQFPSARKEYIGVAFTLISQFIPECSNKGKCCNGKPRR